MESSDAGMWGDKNSAPSFLLAHPFPSTIMPSVFPRPFAAMLMLAMACVGCGDSLQHGRPSFLAGIDPQLIERHGNLYFVTNPNVGYQVASDQGLPCLIFFTAEWCSFCHRMAETTFDDSQVGQLGQNFVCITVDADRQRLLCGHFSINGFPTVEFVSPQGRSLHRLIGQQSAAQLAAGMQTALGRFAWVSDSRLR